MTTRFALALLKRGGVSLLAAVALGWYVLRLDTQHRADLKEMQSAHVAELTVTRKDYTDTLREIAKACRVAVVGGVR